jgi:hypothetical protein
MEDNKFTYIFDEKPIECKFDFVISYEIAESTSNFIICRKIASVLSDKQFPIDLKLIDEMSDELDLDSLEYNDEGHIINCKWYTFKEAYTYLKRRDNSIFNMLYILEEQYPDFKWKILNNKEDKQFIINMSFPIMERFDVYQELCNLPETSDSLIDTKNIENPNEDGELPF